MATPASEVLQQLRLGAHVSLFEEEGIDDVQSILALTPTDWDALAQQGFKRGHKAKLLQALD